MSSGINDIHKFTHTHTHIHKRLGTTWTLNSQADKNSTPHTQIAHFTESKNAIRNFHMHRISPD